MIFVGSGLGRGVALALLGHRMDQHRAMLAVADIFEHWDQMVEIMPVDRADIIEAELLEERSAHRHAARELVGLLCRLVQRVRQLAREAPRDPAQLDRKCKPLTSNNYMPPRI